MVQDRRLAICTPWLSPSPSPSPSPGCRDHEELLDGGGHVAGGSKVEEADVVTLAATLLARPVFPWVRFVAAGTQYFMTIPDVVQLMKSGSLPLTSSPRPFEITETCKPGAASPDHCYVELLELLNAIYCKSLKPVNWKFEEELEER